MTISVCDSIIYLEGACLVEEAEQLTDLLGRRANWIVDISRCQSIHGAVFQTLLENQAHYRVRGDSPSPFIRQFIQPALETMPV